jgi:hypothetical protein
MLACIATRTYSIDISWEEGAVVENKQVPVFLALALGLSPVPSNAATEPPEQSDNRLSLELIEKAIQALPPLSNTQPVEGISEKGTQLTAFYSCFCNYNPYFCPGSWWRNC